MTSNRVDARERLRTEYRDMPGLRLTARQAERLCGIPSEPCQRALEALVREGVLRRVPPGFYVSSSNTT